MNPTKRTELRRIPDRGSRDRETINQILDGGFLACVGFCVDGQPFVIPTLYGRDEENLMYTVRRLAACYGNLKPVSPPV